MENNDPNPSGDVLHDTNGIVALKQKIEVFEHRFNELDKSNSRGLDILKWGMGMFITFAIVFASFIAGFNWWAGKTSYDKDKDFLHQQADLLSKTLVISQKELAFLNDKQLDNIRNEAATNNAILSAAIQKNSLDGLILLRSNLYERFQQLSASLNDQLRLYLQTNDVVISNLMASYRLSLSNATALSEMELRKTEALALSVRGDQYSKSNDGKTLGAVYNLGIGIRSFADAALASLKANDELQLWQYMFQLECCLEIALSNSPPKILVSMESMGLGRNIDELIAELKASNVMSEHYGEVADLERFRKRLKGLVLNEVQSGRAPPFENMPKL